MDESETEATDTLILYKYMTPGALKGLIEHGDIRISTRDDVNDPYELAPYGVAIDGKKEAHTGFISLSGNAQSPAMWGNYADHYKGACVEFHIPYAVFSENTSNVYTIIGELLTRFGIPLYPIADRIDNANTAFLTDKFIVKCRYTYERKPIREALPNNKLFKNFPQSLQKKISDFIAIANKSRTKYAQWRDEDEYRILLKVKDATRYAYINGQLMIFSDVLTPYIKRVLISPRAETTAGKLDAAFRQAAKEQNEKNKGKTKNTLPANIRIIQGDFSKNSFYLNNLALPEQHKMREARRLELYKVIEYYEALNEEEKDKFLSTAGLR